MYCLWKHETSHNNIAFIGCIAGKTRTKDKYRLVYTEVQKVELEKEYLFSHYISIQRKAELARTIGLSDRQVKIWFQNRRAKERKTKRPKGSSSGPEDQSPSSSLMAPPFPSPPIPVVPNAAAASFPMLNASTVTSASAHYRLQPQHIYKNPAGPTGDCTMFSTGSGITASSASSQQPTMMTLQSGSVQAYNSYRAQHSTWYVVSIKQAAGNEWRHHGVWVDSRRTLLCSTVRDRPTSVCVCLLLLCGIHT